MEEPQRRQRPMLSRQLSIAVVGHLDLPPTASAGIADASSSSNFRELLTVRQEEDLQLPHQRAGVSLGTALACEKRDMSSPRHAAATSPSAAASSTGSSRTLFDIIHDEEESSGGGEGTYDDGIFLGIGGGHKISWRAFKDRLRIRRAGAAWQSTAADVDFLARDLVISAPVSSSGITVLDGSAAHVGGPVPQQNPSPTVSGGVEAVRPPTPVPAATTGLQLGVEQEQGGSTPGGAAASATATSGDAEQQPPQQIRVSLMALLEETDREGDGPGFAVSALLEAGGEAVAEEEEDEDEEEEEEGSGGEGGKMYVKCCVCMVRHKGAAFIPCGHTFCRLCSRELWVSRGNCPLCNGFILEILDIF